MTGQWGKYWFWCAITLVLLVVLLPVLLFPHPPLLDYPNHLVRLWLLEGGLNTPPLGRIYIEDWHGIGTNIGIDLIAKAVAPIIPAFTLGRVLLALAIVLPPFGAMALNIAQFRRLEPWQLVFAYLCFAETLLAGFLNFHLGLGLALLAATVDEWPTGPWARRAWRLAAASILLVIHPFALLFYCALLAGLEFGPLIPQWTVAGLRPRLLRAAEGITVCLVPLAVFLATRPLPGGVSEGRWTIFNTPPFALAGLLSPFSSYDIRVDIAFGYPLVVLVLYAAATRRFRIHAGLVGVAALLLVASLFMPAATYESGWLDHRLPIMGYLAALAGTRIEMEDSWRPRLAAGAVALMLLRSAWIAWSWSAGDAMAASLQRATADLPAGAAVLTVRHVPPVRSYYFPPHGRILGRVDDSFRHLTLLLIPWRHVFVPTLFAEPGKQPIRVRPPWDRIAIPQGGQLPSVNELRYPRHMPPAYQNWKRTFDYVVVLNADKPDRFGPVVLPPELQLVRDEGFVQLYRVKTTGTVTPGR
jgi:hypothetical protein